MRVLLMAEDCCPDRTSLPALTGPSLPIAAYAMVRALSCVTDLTLVTHARNRQSLEGRLPGVQVQFVDTEYVAGPLRRLAPLLRGGGEDSWSTAVAAYPSVLAFEYEVRRAFGRRLDAGEFDLVHRLTPTSPALPSPMASWSPTPFVLGPLNGGLLRPPQFAAEHARERGQLRHLRRAYERLPYQRSTFRDASAILTAFQHTVDSLPESARDRCMSFPEVGVAPELFQHPGQRPDREQVVFLSVGRFVPLELLDLAVRVFAQSEKLRAHRLVLVGDGMERPSIERQVREAGLAHAVELTGDLDQAGVTEQLRRADVFFFPSIRELGGGVIVEAMAAGCVPVVVRYGGPGGIVDEQDCGAAVPLGSKEALVRSFTAVLERYVDDRALRRSHAQGAYERAVDHFSWQAKARKLHEVYEWVLGRRSLKPAFGERAQSTPWPAASLERAAAASGT